MNTTSTRHDALRSKMRRGEFRAGRARDITPYLNDRIPYWEMVELVGVTVNERMSHRAQSILAALDLLYDAERKALPMLPGREDIYTRDGAAWVLSRALLVATEHDLKELCQEVEASGVLV